MDVISGISSFLETIWGWLLSVVDYVTENPDAIAFIAIIAIASAAAIFVVISKEIVHSAFYLALTMICIAITYFFLEAEFVGVVQLMVYVGAVTILFAFSIMLTRNKIGKEGGDDE